MCAQLRSREGLPDAVPAYDPASLLESVVSETTVRRVRSTEGCAAWLAELDRLELDVLVLERRLRSGAPPRSDPWAVPPLSTPMPPELLGRAVAIQRRQRAVLGALHEALDELRRPQG